MTKLSVITVCFNSVETIEDTIRSVASQSHPDIEYVIVDGGSTDGTLAIIDKYRRQITTVISEPDQGIYDAMNKGIDIATGDIVAFINADDFYASDNVLEKIVEAFNDPQIDAIYGDLCYVKKNNPSQTVRYWKSSPFVPTSFEKGWCPPHPTFVVRRHFYKRLGVFNLRYQIAADVELMMRFLEVHRLKTRYIPEVLVNMRMGGTTNQSIRNIIKQNREILTALREHGLRSSSMRLLGHKFFSRGMQFFARPFEAGQKG